MNKSLLKLFLFFKVNLKTSRFSPYIKKVAKRFKSICKKKYSSSIPMSDIAIIDDIFPHYLSAFRIAEFNGYLKHFESSKIYSTAAAFGLINEPKTLDSVIAEYEVIYPEFQQRVINLSTIKIIKSKLVYLIFLNNAYSFLENISEVGSPFVFTLYPGGGFQLNDTTSDKKLRTIFLSPYFKKVIVTQKVTYDYLVSNKFLSPAKIAFIYGGVFPVPQKSQKKRYRVEKKTFDICFVANKYMQKGIDKGYDTFIKVVKDMQTISDIRFHVVGSFSEDDIDAGELANQISFYGIKETSFFKSFYPEMDIILSPNIPFTLAPGAFDGFPTGCCVEAAFHGVAVFCTDKMGQNLFFTDRDDIVLISNNSEMIVKNILYYYHNLSELYKIAMNGEIKFREIFSFENQLKPRIELLEQILY